MIARRALPLLAVPALARAQERLRRVGLLSPGRVSVDMFRTIVMPELARAGFVEGRNLEVVIRISEGLGEPLRLAAEELLAQRPEVVSAASMPAVRAIFTLDQTIPIVMFGSSPLVGSGMARSFARPGGSVTGVVLLAEELNVKRVELAIEAFPAMRQFGFLAGAAYTHAELASLHAIAAQRGVALAIERAARPGDEARAIAALVAAGVGVVVVGASPLLASNIAAILAATEQRGLPTVCEWRYLAQAGCTLSYGPEHVALRRRHAQQIARVLRGEHPSTIPIEIADRFELVVNLRAARRLGIEFGPLLLARADEVIE
jgi:putative ABC transport system substrate-binding protein